ncbi:predicted protein [Chaetoceros tenuissimus]|uniref:Uncharacterized protein n=1 Tax=Chaetoceros tenuissimus TaxID=426638 RepID=A0AAD3H9R6_9STRA|nr:predicted protein [Chaetoceros tenuissimus]
MAVKEARFLDCNLEAIFKCTKAALPDEQCPLIQIIDVCILEEILTCCDALLEKRSHSICTCLYSLEVEIWN